MRGCFEICPLSDSVPGTVYAFEPVPENFLMASFVEENQLANAAVQCGSEQWLCKS